MSTLKSEEVKARIVELANNGYNKQEIANIVDIPRQTVSNFLNKDTWSDWWDTNGNYDFDNVDMSTSNRYEKTVTSKRSETPLQREVASVKKEIDIYKIVTGGVKPDGCNHFFIPDTQCKGGISFEYLRWIGEYIVDRKPDVIIHAGDHADMPSLSSYDKGKRTAEGKRVMDDINAAIEGMNVLLKPLYDYQQAELAEFGEIRYKPRMVFTFGNHCYRIDRHVDSNPELYGFLSRDNLRFKEFGWEVYDFLEPVVVNGVTYIHYMPSPLSGKPYGGSALNILKQVGESTTCGHTQVLDIATRFLPASGRQQWFIKAGACYLHDEEYKGYTGNKHWRGVIVKHHVADGSYNPMFVDLDFLKRKYG